MSPRTLGVEEELLLVDPDSLRPVARAGAAVAANRREEEVGHELFGHQLETSTEPAVEPDDVLAQLRAGRRAVQEAARAAGAVALPLATSPLAPEVEEFTPHDRYLRFEGAFGEVAREAHVCAMHVHVGIESREEGLRVLDGIRPWLPLLVAMSANSPYWRGHDTGFASWRTVVWGRWATTGSREPFGDAATYDEVARSMVEWGAALDPGMLYFDARLSAHAPTVEVRVADVCLEAEDALLVAVLVRGLVSTYAGRDAEPWRADLLRAATWRAARVGLGDELVHPLARRLAPPREVLAALLEVCGEHVDADLVESLVEPVLARGTGAVQQRRVHEREGDVASVVRDLVDRIADP
ncbi:YbdK family carboxylate-amine ligase [Nocardioides mangrovicus]|uniref:Putative glutamate--cysteine ligase 2 n=1 Tax=Nocardioides mangrovicus TaxID=2478913 RepID=A0A3L8P7W4_9ACTN|nr:glutamate--cysteine ligase [Nocardioides mangrovicus]RLV51067.1 YbdK family carboxylate-amine ligase [Nocardioides mangrovicus]